MKKLLEYDDFTGITSTFEQEESTGIVHVSQSADVEGALEYTKALRNDEDYSKRGIKNEFWHYAHVPNIVLEQMIKRGLNPYGPGMTKEIMKIIDRDYPHLKVTTKHHA